jgi:hypothetical protein
MSSEAPLVRKGDWLVLAAGATGTALLFAGLWSTDAADKAVIRSDGKVVAEVRLTEDRTLTVAGPLGTTVIRIENHRARVARDPSPRQYCVRQGWLSRAGETALCLPNRVSVELVGAKRLYDSLAY